MDIETFATYNPFSLALQRYWTAPQLESMGGRVEGGRALDLGCGRGWSTKIVDGRFGPSEIHAFDLRPDAIRRAKRRLEGGKVPAVRRVYVGDATSIDEPDESFDAVFEFFVIHNIPRWRDAVGEVARVLKPGGRFYFGEHTREALEKPLNRLLFENPEEGFFTPEEWAGVLETHGLDVGDRCRVRVRGHAMLGVAVKGAATRAPG